VQAAPLPVYPDLEGMERFSQNEFKRMLIRSDLLLAEIESGTNGFAQINRELLKRMIGLALARGIQKCQHKRGKTDTETMAIHPDSCYTLFR